MCWVEVGPLLVQRGRYGDGLYLAKIDVRQLVTLNCLASSSTLILSLCQYMTHQPTDYHNSGISSCYRHYEVDLPVHFPGHSKGRISQVARSVRLNILLLQPSALHGLFQSSTCTQHYCIFCKYTMYIYICNEPLLLHELE